jgi:hypothetical protein
VPHLSAGELGHRRRRLLQTHAHAPQITQRNPIPQSVGDLDDTSSPASWRPARVSRGEVPFAPFTARAGERVHCQRANDPCPCRHEVLHRLTLRVEPPNARSRVTCTQIRVKLAFLSSAPIRKQRRTSSRLRRRSGNGTSVTGTLWSGGSAQVIACARCKTDRTCPGGFESVRSVFIGPRAVPDVRGRGAFLASGVAERDFRAWARSLL